MMAIVKAKSRYSVPMSLWLVEKNQRSTKLCLWPWSSWAWELSAAAGYVDMCCLPRVCLSVTASCCYVGRDDRSDGRRDGGLRVELCGGRRGCGFFGRRGGRARGGGPSGR